MGQRRKRIVVGISGASGSILAVELIRALARHQEVETIHVVATANALRVSASELDPPASTPAAIVQACILEDGEREKVVHHPDGDIGANIASGSYLTDSMVIIPCSSGTLAAIAHGISRGLVQRTADLTLKERRRLILVLRETPLSMIHAANILAATQAGAIVMPPIPSFYAGQSWEDFLTHFTMRVLDLLGLDTDPAGMRWDGSRKE
jgi:2,5-furandicarboxylate decarboxylase 2